MNADPTEERLEQLLEWVSSHHFGKYRGQITDNNDPSSRGRVKVRVPSVLGESDVWAMPCVPYAGAGVGFYCIPEPGTNVWVEFEAGDPSFPVWTGCFWADGELPDASDPDIKIWKTGAITLRADDSAKELLIESSKGAKVTIESKVVTDAGGATSTVGSAGVVSEQGASKTEVTSTSFRVNSGALEVM
ncbi:MAG: phage baseplate assembly protein V [Dehalococcoidia bacterium]